MAEHQASRKSIQNNKKNPLNWKDILFGSLLPILAVLAALFAGGVMLLLIGANPIQAYAAMIVGVFGCSSLPKH